jgi:hypothetical protein
MKPFEKTLGLVCLTAVFFINTSVFAQRTTNGVKPQKTTSHYAPKEEKVDCKLGRSFERSICSSIEDNKAYLIKYQLQNKSGKNSTNQIKEWTQKYYQCIECKDEPGFSGGTMLRKVVFENSLSVAFLLVYEMQVDMNMVEEDGYTLLDWLQNETEKTFDEAFETEDEDDKKWLLKSLNNNLKYFNLFRNNGAKFTHELIAERGQQLREEEEGINN